MPSITCGNCHGTHSSVTEVKWCYDNWISKEEIIESGISLPNSETEAWNEVTGNGSFHAMAEEAAASVAIDEDGPVYTAKKPKTNDRPPRVSANERVYLSVPFADKERAKPYGARWDRDAREWWVSQEDFDRFRDELRPWIKREVTVTKIADRPSVQTVKGYSFTKEQLPEGYYALLNEDDEWRFYRVTWGHGRWEGQAFLEVQASDDLHKIRDLHTKNAIFARIAKDPREAALQYGHQIGRCSVCNRTLTNDESIAAGIGPVCAGKRGW